VTLSSSAGDTLGERVSNLALLAPHVTTLLTA